MRAAFLIGREDPIRVVLRLQQLQLLLQDGELTEEAYEGLEEALIARLRAVREYQKSQEVK
jgi:hypothetical protein